MLDFLAGQPDFELFAQRGQSLEVGDSRLASLPADIGDFPDRVLVERVVPYCQPIMPLRITGGAAPSPCLLRTRA